MVRCLSVGVTIIIQSPKLRATAAGFGNRIALLRITAALSAICVHPALTGTPRGRFSEGLSQSWRRKVAFELSASNYCAATKASYCLPNGVTGSLTGKWCCSCSISRTRQCRHRICSSAKDDLRFKSASMASDNRMDSELRLGIKLQVLTF